MVDGVAAGARPVGVHMTGVLTRRVGAAAIIAVGAISTVAARAGAQAYPGGGGGAGGGFGGGGAGGGLGASGGGTTFFPSSSPSGTASPASVRAGVLNRVTSLAFTGFGLLILVVVALIAIATGLIVLRLSRRRSQPLGP